MSGPAALFARIPLRLCRGNRTIGQQLKYMQLCASFSWEIIRPRLLITMHVIVYKEIWLRSCTCCLCAVTSAVSHTPSTYGHLAAEPSANVWGGGICLTDERYWPNLA